MDRKMPFAATAKDDADAIKTSRNAGELTESTDCGTLRLDLIARQAFLHGEEIHLSPKEFSLLLMFISNIEEPMNIDRIYERVWGSHAGGGIGINAVKTAISRLRMKLDDSEFMIITKRGVGYCFVKQ